MNLCFVCNGNNSRSPMAEAIARRIAEERCIRNANFSSFGINAADGKPVGENTIHALQEIGIDITGKRRQRYSTIEHNSDMVYIAMDRTIYDALIIQYHIDSQRVHLLGNGIFDPKGGEPEVYCKCRDEIKSALLEMFDMFADFTQTTSQTT